MFPYVRLTADEIERCLRPIVERAYEGDATAQKAADVTILAISHGASLLRWLAGLDEDRLI